MRTPYIVLPVIFAFATQAAPGAAPGAKDGTAAAAFNWGAPIASDEFDGNALSGNWKAYDSPGHAGKGVRSPTQATVGNGHLTIVGLPDGTTEGLSWQPGRLYGRWEVRMKAPAGCSCYHPVLILWPDANDFPSGGEVDFAEVLTADRQNVKFFLHYSSKNAQIRVAKELDVTEWHNYAVEWTADRITGFIDGEPWFSNSDKEKLPPRAMHLTVQLDWFPKEGVPATGGEMSVDWVRIYI